MFNKENKLSTFQESQFQWLNKKLTLVRFFYNNDYDTWSITWNIAHSICKDENSGCLRLYNHMYDSTTWPAMIRLYQTASK